MKRFLLVEVLSFISFFYSYLFAQQKIQIIASHAIRENFGSFVNYKTIEECGFTTACEYYPTKEEAIKHLAIAAGTKVKLIIWCPEILNNMEKTVHDFCQYSSFGGYLLFDEPGADKFNEIAKQYMRLRRLDNEHYIWINLFPITAEKYRLHTSSYEEYVDEYLKKVKPSFLSFDNYGIDKNGIRLKYYQNLEIISSLCKTKQIPFWAYVLTSQFGNYEQPTKGTLSLQAYNNLAYGAQGIEYFSYRRILDYQLNMICAPVDTNYQKMPVYYDVKELNAEIQYYSSFFYGCDVKEVTHLSKDIPIGTRQTGELPFRIKIDNYNGKGFVVSHFFNGSHEYLLFVNKDYSESQTVVLETPRRVKRISYYSSERFIGRGKLTFTAQPGSIILLHL